MYCSRSSPTLTNCTINGNSANHFGGGVYCRVTGPEIVHNIIQNNTVGNPGAGELAQGGGIAIPPDEQRFSRRNIGDEA